MSNERWRKSSFSEPNGACIELADLGDYIGVRDSKDPKGPRLQLTRSQVAALIDGVKAGEYDDLT